MVVFEEIFTLEKLNDAFYEYMKKANKSNDKEVLAYESNLLPNNIELLDSLLDGTYEISPTTDFDVNERGKLRHIQAPAIRDRIVQKILCEEILNPQITPKLIYDNYGSIKNRGTKMARKRVNIMLAKAKEEWGTDFYVLKTDIKSYFDNIDHGILKRMLSEVLQVDEKTMNLINYTIDHSNRGTNGNYLENGLNLGSEPPQILSAFYLSKMDNFIKCHLGEKYYARYCDDIILFLQTKEKASKILKGIERQIELVGLSLNKKKTQIIKVLKGFTYLKIKYKIDKITSKIIRTLTHDKVHRENKKLKAYKRKYGRHELTLQEILRFYKGWRNSITKGGVKQGKQIIKESNACFHTMVSMDNLFYGLFRTTISIEEKKHIEKVKHIRPAFTVGRKDLLWQN